MISTELVFIIGVNSRNSRNSSKSIFGFIGHAFAGTMLTTGFFPDDVIDIFKRLLEHITFCLGLIRLLIAVIDFKTLLLAGRFKHLWLEMLTNISVLFFSWSLQALRDLSASPLYTRHESVPRAAPFP